MSTPNMQGFDIKPLEHYSDARGWNVHPVIYSLIDEGSVKNVHIVSLEPGTVRGNHYHFTQTEHFFIMGGPCLIIAVNSETGEKFEQILNPGELFLFTARPGIAHGFKNISDKTIYALCYSDLRYDPASPDTRPFVVIEPVNTP